MIQKLSKEEQIQSLAEMQEELEGVKSDVDTFNDDLGDVSDISMEDGDFFGDDLSDEDKEKAKEIKTPEDVKNALSEAKKDIEAVIDNLDGVIGQTSDEQKTAKFKRPNEKYASTITALAKTATKAIDDAKNAMNHWSFLTKLKKKAKASKEGKTSSKGDLKSALETIKEAKRVVSETEQMFVKNATSVPPTGAEFTGDKWPNGKNPAEVELRHWHAGADKIKKDKKFEDARPNPAVDERLTSVEYQRNDAPYVNATLHLLDGEGKYGSYWDIWETKTNKRMLVPFVGIPDKIGAKDDVYFNRFISKRYGNSILQYINDNGFDAAKEELNGRLAKFNPGLAKTAAESKTNLRKYYTDAYGERQYASQLTSNEGRKEKMNEGYTPQNDTIKEYDEHTKDGPGTLSNQNKKPVQKVATAEEKAVLQAKADRAVELAKLAASRGVIPYTIATVRKQASIYFKYSDDQYKAVEATLSQLPLINEAAMKEAHIPETENGIVGNPSQGVSEPTAQVDTEGIDSGVASDAKIAKQATIVPQVSQNNGEQKPLFESKLVNTLNRTGVAKRIKTAQYKQS
ncbi:MAG: hypothetical protein M0R03_03450 [Novosphingobium sp.]|nr:hypothetical protein [Novosphingobium sp.]